MKLCDRCRAPGCLLDYGGKACKNARKQNCPDVVFTNADRVREMNDEELAKFMLSSNGAALPVEARPVSGGAGENFCCGRGAAMGWYTSSKLRDKP